MKNKLETAVEQMKRFEMEQIYRREHERYNQMSQINYPTPTLGEHAKHYGQQTVNTPVRQGTPISSATVYSIAEVQLTGGRIIGMTISAAPTIGKHLIETMKNTGYLHIFNDSESLMIRSEEIVAVKITKLTTE